MLTPLFSTVLAATLIFSVHAALTRRQLVFGGEGGNAGGDVGEVLLPIQPSNNNNRQDINSFAEFSLRVDPEDVTQESKSNSTSSNANMVQKSFLDLGTPVIIGISVGALLLVLLIVLSCCCCACNTSCCK